MSRYWAMRTSKGKSRFIYEELKAGRLRQGWGGEDYLNLNVIRDARSGEKKLNDYQEDVWRRQRRLHPDEEDSIQKGDYILLPNLPDKGSWSICKIISNNYRYEIDPKFENYGHIREIKLLNPNKPINPYSEFVSGNLRKTMTCRLRLWNIDDYKEDIENLLLVIGKKNLSEPTTEANKLLKIYHNLSDKLENELKNKYHGSEFENPVKELLERIYQNVECRAGPGEKGADFICNFSDGLGIAYRVVVQVKMWEGTTEWERPLEQIKEAYNNNEHIAAGVIITTSESSSESFEKLRIKLEGELNIPIIIIDKEELTKVFLRYLPELIETDDVK